MNPSWIHVFSNVQRVSQVAAALAIAGMAVVMAALVGLAVAGRVPWLSLPTGNGTDLGPHVQIGLTLLLTALCSYLPSSLRVMRLEAAHREFAIRMEDVGRAYWAAHAADRAGTFTLAREFDAVRERFLFLRHHPDLGDLDPNILELAAQMSHEARELARVYSDDKVDRAREMIALRRHEAAEMEARIEVAISATSELKRLVQDIEIDEDTIRSRVARLRDDLDDIGSRIGMPETAKLSGPIGVVAVE